MMIKLLCHLKITKIIIIINYTVNTKHTDNTLPVKCNVKRAIKNNNKSVASADYVQAKISFVLGNFVQFNLQINLIIQIKICTTNLVKYSV